MKTLYKLSVISLFLLGCQGKETKYYRIHYYTAKDGLMTSNIKGIGQDEQGRIWVANGRGFNILDGKDIKTIKGDLNYFQWGNYYKLVFKDNKIYFDSEIFDRDENKFKEGGSLIIGNSSYAYWPGGSEEFGRGAEMDGHGNYWCFNAQDFFASKKGVYKYDGENIIRLSVTQGLCNDSLIINSTYFKTEPKNKFSNPNFIIDNHGDVWIRSKIGLYKYNYTTEKFEFLKIKLTDASKIFVDTKNRVWLFSNSGSNDSLYCYSDNILKGYGKNELGLSVNYTVKAPKTDESLGSINVIEDKKGRLFFISLEGIKQFVDKKFISRYKFRDILFNDQALADNSDGVILKCLENTGASSLYYFSDTSLTQIIRLSNNRINTVFADKENVIWVATEKGLYKCMPSGVKHEGIESTNYDEFKDPHINYLEFKNIKGYNEIKHKGLRFLFKSKNGDSYFNTYHDFNQIADGGIYLIRDGQLKPILEEKINFNPSSIIEDKDGKIWVCLGTGLEGFYKIYIIENYEAKPLVSKTLKPFEGTDKIGMWPKLRQSESGKLMFLSYKQGVFMFEGNDFVLHPFKESGHNYPLDNGLIHDAFFMLQAGNNALVKFDEIKNKFIDILSANDLFIKDSVMNGYPMRDIDYIENIIVDDHQAIWAFGRVGGRGIYRIFNNKITIFPYDSSHFNIGYGSPILKDKKGNYWFTTGEGGAEYKSGIVCMTVKLDGSISFKKITEKNGLSTNIITDILFDLNGNLWLTSDYAVDKLDVNLFNENGTIKIKNYGLKQGIVPGWQLYLDKDGNVCLPSDEGITVINPK